MSKKTSLIIRLILLILAFLLVAASAVRVALKGWESMSISFSGEPVSSEQFTDVTSIAVDAVAYSIEVAEYDGSSVVAEFYRSGIGSAAAPETALTDGALVIQEASNPVGIHLGGGKIKLHVPAGSLLPYQLCSASGSIRLDAGSSTSELHTASGSVKVFQSGERLAIQTTSGSVKVYEPFNSLDIQTTSGSIKASAGSDTADAKLKSVSGSIKLKLDGVSGYTMDYSTVSGSVKNEYPAMEYNYAAHHKHGSAVWSDGSLSIQAETTSGSIKLTDWDD